MQRSPSRKNRWGEVLNELAVQQNLLHELLASEASRSNSASRSRSPRVHESVTPPRTNSAADDPRAGTRRRAHLISPSPDGSRLSAEADLDTARGTSTPPERRSSARPGSGESKKEAVTHLVEALSTSSWSSNASERDGTPVEPDHHHDACDPDTDRGSRHRFFAAVMRLVDDEYDARQAVVLKEMMNFTEMSSVYLLTSFTACTPEHL